MASLCLKLFIDHKAGKVIFAETDKTFVDFLVNVLSLPVAAVTKHLTDATVGSLANLHKSVASLPDVYILPTKSSGPLLKQSEPLLSKDFPFILPGDVFSGKRTYICEASNGKKHTTISYIADDPKAVCPVCGTYMTTEGRRMHKVSSVGSGFVKEVAYIVTDDLNVRPQSAVNTFDALNVFNIKEFGSLEVKDVRFGLDEAVKLLNAAMGSKSVLSAVFLGQ